MQYIYGFNELATAPDHATSAEVTPRRLLSGPSLDKGKSSTMAAVLKGAHIIVALAGQQAGSGAKAHTHPNEQFNYILQGVMVSDIAAEKQTFGATGTIVHTPAMSVHTGQACPDEDLIFFAMKDTRHGIVGPPVDGKYDGPNYLPGFGTRTHEARKTTAQMMADAGTHPEGNKTRYIYDFKGKINDDEKISSARSMPYQSAPIGVSGSLLISEKLQVAVLDLLPGAGLPVHAHENEQFTLVAEGSVSLEMAGNIHPVAERFVIHAPVRVSHGIVAGCKGARIVVVQDTRFAFAG